jgi:hypothetical protein
MSNRNLERLFKVAEKNIFTINGTMDYPRIVELLTRIASEVEETETDDDTWAIGEFSYCCLPDLITGAYWHFTEWHAGQSSPEYAALCALGYVFDPGMSCPEYDNEAYILLAEMAQA